MEDAEIVVVLISAVALTEGFVQSNLLEVVFLADN